MIINYKSHRDNSTLKVMILMPSMIFSMIAVDAKSLVDLVEEQPARDGNHLYVPGQ